MLAIRAPAALSFACIAAGLASAAPVPAPEFHAKVVEPYSFEPHKLKKDEMQAKSDQLDKFWAMVKADPAGTLPLLRSELANPANSAFFFYDGSKLLLSLSDDRADQALALRSVAKADLQGIQDTDYLRTVHRLASKGLDAREAAFRILAFPDFQGVHRAARTDARPGLLAHLHAVSDGRDAVRARPDREACGREECAIPEEPAAGALVRRDAGGTRRDKSVR
jgi:hypothetical protein